MNVIGLFPIACASPIFALITDENGFSTPFGKIFRMFKHHDNMVCHIYIFCGMLVNEALTALISFSSSTARMARGPLTA